MLRLSSLWILLLIVLLATGAYAQQTEDDKVRARLENRRITLSFSDTPLKDAMGFLRDVAGLNIIIDPSVEKDLSVTLRMRDIKLKNALKLVLAVDEELGYIVKGGTIIIATKKRLAEILKEKKPKKDCLNLKQGELLFILKDGSKIKGKVAMDKWKLKTAYGELTIPANEIKKIRLADKAEEGEEEKEEAPDEDEVETIRFTVTGELQVEKLEIEIGKGKLTIPKSDIKAILFPRPVIEKSFEIKPIDEWLNTGIKLEKGDTLKITATGQIDDEYSPDARETVLVGRIGKKGKEFKVGSAYMKKKVEEKGRLYLRIKIAKLVEDLEDTFKVKVRVQK